MIRRAGPDPAGTNSDATPDFKRGQLVVHRRYAYRGVIVDFDLMCLADENWYQSNITQPPRNQPWYHVLVHGTTSTTYAAQGNLRADTARQPIDHPLVDHFFKAFVDGCYVRNDEPWPS